MPISDWFMDWITRKKGLEMFLLALVPISLTTIFFPINKRYRSHRFLVITFVISMIYWFYSAPDVRFVWGILTGVSSITLAAFISLIPTSNILKWAMAMIVIYICFFHLKDNRRLSNLWKAHLYYPTQSKSVEVSNIEIDGMLVKIPVEGNRCFDEPIPCTIPQVNRNLKLRGASPKDGFTLN